MNRGFTIAGQCRPKHVAPPNLNKLDVLDVKCLSFNKNILFDASLIICINSNNIPPIMIINRI